MWSVWIKEDKESLKKKKEEEIFNPRNTRERGSSLSGRIQTTWSAAETVTKRDISLFALREAWADTKLHTCWNIAVMLSASSSLLSLTHTHTHTHTLCCAVLCCPHCHDNPVLDADGFPRSFIYSSFACITLSYYHTHVHPHACVHPCMLAATHAREPSIAGFDHQS